MLQWEYRGYLRASCKEAACIWIWICCAGKFSLSVPIPLWSVVEISRRNNYKNKLKRTMQVGLFRNSAVRFQITAGRKRPEKHRASAVDEKTYAFAKKLSNK